MCTCASGSSDKLDTDQKDLEELGLPHLLEFCLQSRNQTEDTDEGKIRIPDFQIPFGQITPSVASISLYKLKCRKPES